jgi:hypothetical protein
MMTQQLVIDFGEGQRGIVKPDDETWLLDKLRSEPGSTRVRVRYDEDEAEGHRMGASPAVRLIAETDDTEGHAISIHFPTRAEADAVRKRLLVAGVLAGTVALGTVGGVGLANMASGDATTTAPAAAPAPAPADDDGEAQSLVRPEPR